MQVLLANAIEKLHQMSLLQVQGGPLVRQESSGECFSFVLLLFSGSVVGHPSGLTTWLFMGSLNQVCSSSCLSLDLIMATKISLRNANGSSFTPSPLIYGFNYLWRHFYGVGTRAVHLLCVCCRRFFSAPCQREMASANQPIHICKKYLLAHTSRAELYLPINPAAKNMHKQIVFVSCMSSFRSQLESILSTYSERFTILPGTFLLHMQRSSTAITYLKKMELQAAV